MKTKLISFVVSIALACVYVACQQKPEHPAPANQPIAPGALPSTVLQPFLDNRLNTVLAPLDAPGLKDAQTNPYYANLAQNNAFNAKAYYAQWLQRSAELRQQIEQLYTRERETEAQLKQSPGS